MNRVLYAALAICSILIIALYLVFARVAGVVFALTIAALLLAYVVGFVDSITKGVIF